MTCSTSEHASKSSFVLEVNFYLLIESGMDARGKGELVNGKFRLRGIDLILAPFGQTP